MIIQGGRWESYFRRLFSLKGAGEPQSVSPEIIGTAAVIPARPEDAILRRDKLYHGTKLSTAAAGNYGYVRLRNESSDQLVILENIAVFDGVAAYEFELRMGNTAVGTTGVTVGGRDTRLGLTLASRLQAGQIYFGHAAAIGGTLVQTWGNIADKASFPFCPIILAPDDVVILWHKTANRIIGVTFAWREREAEPGELNL